MDRHGIRYFFEHQLLPQWFFKYQFQFIGILLNRKGLLYQMIDDLFKEQGLENPYTPDLFDVTAKRLAEQMSVKISFPEPEEEPLCYCSYLFFDQEFDKVSYFCIERGNPAGQMHAFVCSWTQEETHLNHGHCHLGEEGDFLRCAEIYREQFTSSPS